MTSQDNFAVPVCQAQGRAGMAVHGAVPQPGRAGGSGAGDGRSLQRPQRRAESIGQGAFCRPGPYKRGNMFGMTIKFAFSELDFASALLRSPPCAAFSASYCLPIR